MVDDRGIARSRLRNQHLTGARAPGAVEVVTDLLAVQAENHSQASWAVAARTRDLSEADFAALFDDGAILRTHVLRPTWHFVCPDDIGWLLELTRPRIWPLLYRQLARESGFGDQAIERARQRTVESITDEGHLTRDQLGERLADAGLSVTGHQLMLLAGCLELEGLICSGAVVDGRHTYALLVDRAPGARRLDRDEALAEIALRYVTGHGPATARDLSYWATLTLTDARAGLAAVAERLETFDHDGRTYWHAPSSAPDGPAVPRGHLLQILDECYRGYQDSRWVLDAAGLAPRGRETAAGMALADAQMVATMRRTLHADRVTFELGAFRALDDAQIEALQAAAHRYGHFLGLEARLEWTTQTP